MFTISFLLFLILGATLICVPVAVQMKWYNIMAWKSTIVSISIIITGVIGGGFWFFLENGYWGGKSFFGAVFFAPLTFLLVAKILKIPYAFALDFCATAGCLILAILKIECLVDGCCQGMILYMNKDHVWVRFPSQLVEFITALILTAILIIVSYSPPKRGKLYPLTLILYGLTRFVLNLFRDEWQQASELGRCLPFGNIWALVSIAIGVAWFIVDFAIKKKKTHSGY